MGHDSVAVLPPWTRMPRAQFCRTDEILQTVFRFDLLTRLPRTGFLMRGVDHPESIGEHCFLASVLASLLIPGIRAEGHTLDGEKLLSMVILHEAGEILLRRYPPPPRPSSSAKRARPARSGCFRRGDEGPTPPPRP